MRLEALRLAGFGWRVFPVAEDGRTPLVKGGCYAASCDPVKLNKWWGRWPTANVSLACGPGSGVLALDIDAKGAIDGFAALDELQREFGSLPETVTSRTPSGGRHLLFAYPPGPDPENRVGIKRYGADGERRVYAGLDVRAKGASVCLPPSARPDGRYAWERAPGEAPLATLPRWLGDLIRSEPPRRPAKPLHVASEPSRVANYVCAVVNGACGDLAAMKPGTGRNQALFIAAARFGGFVGAGVLSQSDAERALEAAAEQCGLVSEDGWRSVRMTIANGLKRGVASPREVAA